MRAMRGPGLGEGEGLQERRGGWKTSAVWWTGRPEPGGVRRTDGSGVGTVSVPGDWPQRSSRVGADEGGGIRGEGSPPEQCGPWHGFVGEAGAGIEEFDGWSAPAGRRN